MFEAIDGLPIAIAVNSLKEPSRLEFINQQFTRSFGYTLHDIPTVERWAELAYPDPEYRARVFKIWDAAVEKAVRVQGHVASMEFQVCCKDRSVRDVVFGANVRDSRLIVTLTDVTQRRALERELASTRALLERTAYEVTENIPVGTYTMVQPADGGMAKFSFLSSKFLALTGLKREDALEDPMKAFACVHPEDFNDWVQLNVQAFEHKTRFYGETRIVVNGNVRWISAESVPRPLPDGSTVWEGVLTDITELQESRQAMLQAKVRAERQEKLKGEFLANMSHEIRTPLTSILGLTQLLAHEPLDSKSRAMVTRIQEAGDSLLRIINDVLDYSRIEAGKLHIEPQPFFLATLLAKLEDLHSWMAAEKGIALMVQAAPEISDELLGDYYRIEQVLNNLINNAIKFTHAGQVIVSARVVQAVDHRIRVRFEIQDSGQGIDPELLPLLFEPFYQAETGSSRRFSGSGLGLSISKRLIDLMGGTIGLHSTPGQGSLFWAEVPLTIVTRPVGGPERYGSAHASPNNAEQTCQLAGLKVLIVDDSPSILALINEMLTAEGAECVLAGSAVKALELVRASAQSFSVVLMDIQMPSVDGLAATRMIRQELGLTALPIIAMTAGILQEQQAQALAAGANDIILKPLRIERLVQCLLTRTRPAAPSKETFPKLAKINADHADKTMNGDAAMFLRLLKVFLDEHQHTVGLTRDDLAQGRLAQAARRMHTLRGGAGQLGALDLAAAAQTVERSISENVAAADEPIAQLERELEAIAQSAKPLLHPEGIDWPQP